MNMVVLPEQLALPFTHPPPLQEEEVVWTDEDVEKLRVGLLRRMLNLLDDDRASYESKQESLVWLYSDDIEPFSFFVCCDSADVDAYALREKVGDLIRRNKIQLTGP